ncbi:MAG: response regulator transcription factor [Nitrospirae bacterium]|nr:response regulator transcription factor [Nitrospirota bacterium]
MTTKAGHQVWLNVSILLVPGPGRKAPIIIHQFRPVSGPERVEGLVEQVASRVLEVLKVRGRVPGADQASSATKMSVLTRRETEILRLMAQCLGTKEIADRLCISYSTVRLHIQHILEKLQVHSKVEAVALAFQQNLIQTLSVK